MTDYTELKRLAEAAIIARNEYDADECNADLADEQTAADDAFHDAAGPEEVLLLIAENESLRGSCKAMGADMGKLTRERNSFRSQAEKARAEVAGLRTGYEAYEQVNAELKAENERLRAGVKGDYDLDAWLDWTQEAEALRKLVSDTALELRKASSWICREVEAGTTSATHWAIRLREKADQIGAALGQGEQS
jgi:hypothetical protein